MPGTSAEILDDRIREIISPGRISTRDWMTVIRTAHKVGIPTTSTIMYGHIETALDRARHLELLRSIQKETGGITEFVPLSFIAAEAPMVKKSLVPGVRADVTSRRCFAYVRGRAADAGPMDPEHSSHLGEAGRAARAGVPASGRERFWRDVDERKHLDVGGRAARSIPASGGTSIVDSGGGHEFRCSDRQRTRLCECLSEEPSEPEPSWDGDRFGSYATLIASPEFRFRDRV